MIFHKFFSDFVSFICANKQQQLFLIVLNFVRSLGFVCAKNIKIFKVSVIQILSALFVVIHKNCLEKNI